MEGKTKRVGDIILEMFEQFRRKPQPTIGQLLRRASPESATQAQRDITEVVTAKRGGVGQIPGYLEGATIRYWERRLRKEVKKGGCQGKI